MPVELWVALLRIFAAVLAVSILWPNLLQRRRWLRRQPIGKGGPDKVLHQATD